MCHTLSLADDKSVLINLNGEFRARELSVIVGPSGSGKSTLLNLLSGYKSNDTSGVVKVNGSLRDQKQFRHMSSYVMQDSLLHPLLTVREAMNFSVNLKIGKELDAQEKDQRASSCLFSIIFFWRSFIYTGRWNPQVARVVRHERNLHRKVEWWTTKAPFNCPRACRQPSSYLFRWTNNRARFIRSLSMSHCTEAFDGRRENYYLHNPSSKRFALPPNRPHLCNRWRSMHLSRFLRELSAISQRTRPRLSGIPQSCRLSTWDFDSRLWLSEWKSKWEDSRRKESKLQKNLAGNRQTSGATFAASAESWEPNKYLSEASNVQFKVANTRSEKLLQRQWLVFNVVPAPIIFSSDPSVSADGKKSFDVIHASNNSFCRGYQHRTDLSRNGRFSEKHDEQLPLRLLLRDVPDVYSVFESSNDV